VDSRGVPVSLVAVTDARGFFHFAYLPPSNSLGYTLTVTPPAWSGLAVGRTRGPRGTFGYGRISNVVVTQNDVNLATFTFALRRSDKFIL
jgi:hypothetical protein